MSITQLLLWCLENDVEFSIKTKRDTRLIRISLKKTKSYVFQEDNDFTEEFLFNINLEDPGAHIVKELFERLTRSIERPIQFDIATGKIKNQ